MPLQQGDEIHKEEDHEVLHVSADNSIMDREKQISVDPRSLQHLRKSRDGDDRSLVPPISPAFKDTIGFGACPRLPLPPSKLKYVSISLSNSATSSPRSGSSSTLIKNLKKWRNQNHASSLAIRSLARQQSATVSPFVHQQGSDHSLCRSKSCGEGRACAPSDEFDFLSRKAIGLPRDQSCRNSTDIISHNYDQYHEYEGGHDHGHTNGKTSEKSVDPLEKAFKCGALCLFLPGFGKGKPVRARIKEEAEREKEGEVASVVALSRTVSLEKFECGSWTSSARITSDNEYGESMNSYFDLPLELIQDGGNDANLPVSTAFVFERDRKGVLKKNTSRTVGKALESSRHVRFSTSNPSSPSCISPRLRKAREDFNAYLEAQGA